MRLKSAHAQQKVLDLFAKSHAETELVILLEVVDFRREKEADSHVDALFQIGSHPAMGVDFSAQPRLPQNVVVPKAGLCLARVPVPHEVRRQRHLHMWG